MLSEKSAGSLTSACALSAIHGHTRARRSENGKSLFEFMRGRAKQSEPVVNREKALNAWRQGCIKPSIRSPRGASGRGPRRGETDKSAPPLPSPLLDPMAEREKSRSLMQPWSGAQTCSNWGGQSRVFQPNRLNALVRPPEQHDADGLENEIGQPQDQVREPFGPRLQGLAEDKKAVIDQHQHQRHGDAGGGFAAMRPDSQRNANQREPHAGKRKCHLTMALHSHRLGKSGPPSPHLAHFFPVLVGREFLDRRR